jgi:hypothetical protein
MHTKFSLESLKGRDHLGRQRLKREDNSKMNLMKIGLGDADWIHMAQDRDQWWGLVNTVMNLHFP